MKNDNLTSKLLGPAYSSFTYLELMTVVVDLGLVAASDENNNILTSSGIASLKPNQKYICSLTDLGELVLHEFKSDDVSTIYNLLDKYHKKYKRFHRPSYRECSNYVMFLETLFGIYDRLNKKPLNKKNRGLEC